MADRGAERIEMVRSQLAARGIDDERVLAAMAAVPREVFVPSGAEREAYGDHAVALASGQTISQPWIVAAICQALQIDGCDRVLEIGTGSGYSTAVISRLAGPVVTIERIEELARLARDNLGRLGLAGIEVICADGSVGLPDRAALRCDRGSRRDPQRARASARTARSGRQARRSDRRRPERRR